MFDSWICQSMASPPHRDTVESSLAFSIFDFVFGGVDDDDDDEQEEASARATLPANKDANVELTNEAAFFRD